MIWPELTTHDLLNALVAGILGLLIYLVWHNWRNSYCRNELQDLKARITEMEKHWQVEREILTQRVIELTAEVQRLTAIVDMYEADDRARRARN